MTRLPALFLGHGSPMHAIAPSEFSEAWANIAAKIPRPKAILAISAHWYVPYLAVTSQQSPPTIHDFGGFPAELFAVEYPCPGSPELANRISDLVPGIELDSTSWGLDHGTWSVLKYMYPDASIPVVQVSVDKRQQSQFHYELGMQLAPLRDEGVLIIGTGNIVHNFAYADFGRGGFPEPWALEFEKWVKDTTQDDRVDRSDAKNYPLVHWQEHLYGNRVQNGPDHFLPLLSVLGTANQTEPIHWPVEAWDIGSFSMSCVQIGA